MDTSWSDSTPVAGATPAPDTTTVGDASLSVEAAPLETDYDSAPLESNYNSAPLESSYDSAPPEDSYDTAPLEANYESAPLESNYDSASLESNYDSVPLESDYDSAPLEDSYDAAPLESNYDSVPLESNYDSAPLENSYDSAPLTDVSTDDSLPSGDTEVVGADSASADAVNNVDYQVMMPDGTELKSPWGDPKDWQEGIGSPHADFELYQDILRADEIQEKMSGAVTADSILDVADQTLNASQTSNDTPAGEAETEWFYNKYGSQPYVDYIEPSSPDYAALEDNADVNNNVIETPEVEQNGNAHSADTELNTNSFLSSNDTNSGTEAPSITEEISSTPVEDHEDIRAALEEHGFDTSDYGRGNKAFSAKEVARLTDVSSTEAARAGHDARDHMVEDPAMLIPQNRHGE